MLPHPSGRFSLADPKGGVTLKDETNLITDMCKDLAKTFVKKMISGSFADALKMRTPAFTHAPMTYLDCLRYDFACFEQFLLLAKTKDVLEDPVERLKYITSALVASIHQGIVNVGLRRPLNPILGETSFVTTDHGSTVYME